MAKHFLSINDFTGRQIQDFLNLAMKIKKNPVRFRSVLKNTTVGLLFEKSSLRTKTAFYVGTLQLGGQAVYYAADEVKLGQREKICDASRTFSRFLDAIVLRTFSHNSVMEFAEYSSVPVINGLCDLMHPSQALADVLTICEYKKSTKKLKIAYVGDGNNVCHSLMMVIAKLGGTFIAATPNGYEPKPDIVAVSREAGKKNGADIILTESAQEAAHSADVLYTDVWTSMGKEAEGEARKNIFRTYQIKESLVAMAKPDCLVMHCLPAHRGEEITDNAIDGPRSVVFDQAENKLHTAKAILVYLLK